MTKPPSGSALVTEPFDMLHAAEEDDVHRLPVLTAGANVAEHGLVGGVFADELGELHAPGALGVGDRKRIAEGGSCERLEPSQDPLRHPQAVSGAVALSDLELRHGQAEGEGSLPAAFQGQADPLGNSANAAIEPVQVPSDVVSLRYEPLLRLLSSLNFTGL
ncbi:hypothetical protein [Streptomyces hirsutus]|uniref:hypothetical protein n=1 Tax=Streptomyces hirsutus TaxID=35620 RepID=UPI0036B7045D